MSRYSSFEEGDSGSILNEEDNELICVKDLIAKPNPLMSKIQFAAYDAKNYYPVLMAKLPQMLNNQSYHVDSNNMVSMDEALFVHEKMKKDIKGLTSRKNIRSSELYTLRDFYVSKQMVYEKYNGLTGNYFATFTLNLSKVRNNELDKLQRTNFVIRSARTPLLTERGHTERISSVCRPQIEFNSNFESGNLYRVYQREYNEYDLILQNDINTRGNNQWFFYSVRNVPKGTTVRFNLVNMAKKESLFELGMKPAVFSMARFERRKVGWVRDGTKIHYRQNNEIKREASDYPFYTLSFEYKFLYDGDVVYFAYSIPYTFSNLCSFIGGCLSQKKNHGKVKVRSLGQTFGGNQVSLFQLTDGESRQDKKSIWILGRQHSGEVSSSFMMEGIFNFLLNQSEQSSYLLSNYIFRVVPMLNIDGVVHGNSRAELSGCDSNRKWADPSKIYQPVIYNIKKMIQKDTVQMILDLHSHSRKLGTFFYCNSSPRISQTIKVFPMMVCNNDKRFDYRSNRFRGGNNLTARRIFYELLGIPYIYTVESSLYGYQKEGDFRIIPYQPDDYRGMGETILKTFAQMIVKKKTMKVKDERLLLCPKEQLEQDDNLWDKMNEMDEIQSVGSDDDPAADELSRKELDQIFEKKPKTNMKKRKRKAESKVRIVKKAEEPKKQQQVRKKIDKQSIYKKYFSGRFSMSSRHTSNLLQLCKKNMVETRNFGCQVDIHDKAILNRCSLNAVMTNREKSCEKLFEKRALPLQVVGQRVEEQLTLFGSSVGVQVQSEKLFLRNRTELALENRSVSKRMMRSSHKMTAVMLHNENNFLNKGDILHKAMRMLNAS